MNPATRNGWRQKPRTKPSGLLYAAPEDALKAVQSDFHYWTQKLTEYSFSLSVALIGANWAVFGGAVNKGITSFWSKLSLSSVILSLALVLLGAFILGAWHGKIVDYAEENPDRWAEEYVDTLADRKNPWPYTKTMNIVMQALQIARTVLPVLGGIFFFIGLFA